MYRRTAARLVTLLAALLVSGTLVTVGTSSPSYALDAPSNLSATDAVNPVLSWDRVSGATGYDVELSRTGEFTTATRIGTVVSTVNVHYVPKEQLPQDVVWWRVRAKSGSTLGEYTIGSFTPGTTAPPLLVRPEPDRHFQAPEAPYFTWSSVAGATRYHIQTSRDPAFTDPAGISELQPKTTAAYLTGYPSVGEYYWRVRAELGSGYWTGWSDSRPYQVDGLPQVVRTSPADTFATSVRDVVLDWAPVPGAATYQLQVNTDDAFGQATMKAEVVSIVSTKWAPADKTLNNDEYYWRVRAVDASGNAAPWQTTPWRLRRAWPDQPNLVHPQGTAGGDEPFFYQWTAIERASTYTVYLYDETGTSVCSFSTVHTTLAGQCVPEEAGDYRWKVRATDDPASVITDLIAQPATSFHYEPPAEVTPAPPGTLSTDEVSGHATSITGTAAFASDPSRDACTATLPATCVDLRQTPVLTWDPVQGAETYKLTLAHDRELTNIVSGFNAVEVDQPMYAFTRTLPDSQAGSAYFWVVQPCGETCAPIAYPRHSFAKKTLPPQLVSPANDDADPVGEPEDFVSDDITLDWGSELDALRAPRPPGDTSSLTTPASTEARSYSVQTSVDPLFGSTIDNTTVDETTFTSPANTYPEGFVYWRVRANDGSNNPTVWSATWRFEKRSPRPVLLTPTPGGELGSDYTLSWEALPFAASYDLEVYAGPTKINTVEAIKHTSWAPSEPFAVSDADYTWRVRRVDARTRRGEWSDFRSFRMAGFPPSLAGPDEGDLVAPTGGLFTWLPDPRATSYKFERRKPNDPNNSLAEPAVVTRAHAYAPTSALAAGTAQWRVTALDAAGKDLGASPWRTFVVIDPPATATAVSISGSGKVGTELRAFEPTFDPAAETTTYQWFRGSSSITGATGETYTVTSSDVTKVITVRATGVLTGYKSATSTSNEITGVNGDALVAEYPPTITGEARFGQTLTAQPGTWPGTPSSFAYQWYRDGVAISRATGKTYRLVADDVHRDIHVVETARAGGRADGQAASEPLDVLSAGTLTATSAPTVSGTHRPGQRLSAAVGSWNSSASYRYQWLRNGAPISGATSSSYTVAAADAARKLQVRITATASGWDPGTATSAARTVAKVTSATTLALSRTRATARQAVTATARVTAPGNSAPGGTVTFYDGTRRLATVKLSSREAAVLRLPRLRLGRHTIRAVYSGGTQVAGSTRGAILTITR